MDPKEEIYLDKNAEIMLKIIQLNKTEKLTELLSYISENMIYNNYVQDRFDDLNLDQQKKYYEAQANLYEIAKRICAERGWKEEADKDLVIINKVVQIQRETGKSSEEIIEEMKKRGEIDENWGSDES